MSTNPAAAYHLIKGNLPAYCAKILNVPPCRYWIHESLVAKYLNLPRDNQFGQSEALTALIDCMSKGYGGSKRLGTKEPTQCSIIDFSDNNSPLCIQKYARKDNFDRGVDALSQRKTQPRWFRFGNVENHLQLATQLDLLNHLIGNSEPSVLCDQDPLIGALAVKRRRREFMSFYKQDTPNCKEYLCYDIPAIANDFAHLIWPDVRMNGGVSKLCRRSFGATDLDMLEGEFRMIMVVSNAIEGGKLDVVGLQLRPGSNTRSNRVPTISNVLTRDPLNNQSVTDAEVEVSLSGTDLISPPGSRRIAGELLSFH
jgi:hypothetical protein